MDRPPFCLRPPAIVRQNRAMSCWAAALESWLSVCCPHARYTQDWAIGTFAAWQTGDCRIEWEGLKAIARLFSMRCEETGNGALTPDFLLDRLQAGHLYLTYSPTPGPVAAHTVVVYGIGNAAVSVMDPEQGYTFPPHEFFRSRRRALVCMPSRAGGVIPDPTARIARFLESGARMGSA